MGEVLRYIGPDGQTCESDTRTIEEHRADRINEIAADFERTLGDGITVNGLLLAAGPEDQQQFAYGMTMLNSALLLGVVNAGTLVSAAFGRTVSDKAMGQHDMTVAEYIALALGYAAVIGQLQGKRNTLQNAIRSADTHEVIRAIQWENA